MFNVISVIRRWEILESGFQKSRGARQDTWQDLVIADRMVDTKEAMIDHSQVGRRYHRTEKDLNAKGPNPTREAPARKEAFPAVEIRGVYDDDEQ